jgi:hypothetical protein
LSWLNRREFVQLSTGAMLTVASKHLLSDVTTPTIARADGFVRVKGENYAWEYAEAEDIFSLRDGHGRLIAKGKLQPSVTVAPAADPGARITKPGKAAPPRLENGKVTFTYDGVNGGAQLSTSWRFEARAIWSEPVIYQSPSVEDVVSLHYFAGETGKPSLHASYLVVPGISEGPGVSPILGDGLHLNEDVWLGRGSFIPGLTQQWALPVHFFGGFSLDSLGGVRNSHTDKRSDAFACGLADLPLGDLFLQLYQGSCSPWIDYRSDLWKHLRGPGQLRLGATFLWSVAPDYRQAIAAYYQGLVDAGIVRKRQNSERKMAVALTPQFCTWGSQVDRDKAGDHLDQAYLDEIYRELRASGMAAGLFSIDDKWEEAYGNLVHSQRRLPHFEQFLDQLRADGYKVGIWAALMRCERPEDLGLTVENVLKQPDGKPYLASNFGGGHYYLLDFTQPDVERVLTDLVRKFMRRYKPDLFKFDFGYELPSVSVAAPQDKHWTGERLMWKGLSIVIDAMRKENPDLVVMYYQLSPLFLDYFDLHSTDDLFLASGEYEVEANRRIYFSSLLGPLGVPTYGSSGYDWASAPHIWFDSVAAGSIGSLNDFQKDEQGEGATPELVAKYNGLARVLRRVSTFEVLPFGETSEAPTMGAHARSWARIEGGQLVLLAYRPPAPGEENPLVTQPADLRFKDVVRAHVPLVVASRDSEDITRSSKLAVVSYGGGELLIRRQQGRQAVVVSHYLGNTTVPGEASVEDGFLRLDVAERNAAGQPLEWIEIHIS